MAAGWSRNTRLTCSFRWFNNRAMEPCSGKSATGTREAECRLSAFCPKRSGGSWCCRCADGNVRPAKVGRYARTTAALRHQHDRRAPERGRLGLTSPIATFADARSEPAAPTTSNTTNHAGSTSLPFFDRSGSVHAARLKQQGRRFPLFIFEILTSTRRLRVSGFWVALTQRTHSQRAIGVIPVHRSWIF